MQGRFVLDVGGSTTAEGDMVEASSAERCVAAELALRLVDFLTRKSKMDVAAQPLPAEGTVPTVPTVVPTEEASVAKPKKTSTRKYVSF